MKFLFTFFVTISLITLLSCNKNPKNQKIASFSAEKVGSSSTLDSINAINDKPEYWKSGNFAADKPSSSSTLDSINVIALNDRYKNQAIELYNADGSLWKSFKITDDFQDTSLHIAIKPDYFLLVFRCVGRKGSYYAVNVDNSHSSIKYIKAGLDYFNYEPWEKHIVKVLSVDFDSKANPIRTKPSDQSAIIPFDEEQIYQPQEVKGKWLRIIDDDEKSGWIQWIDDKGNLLVELYYLC